MTQSVIKGPRAAFLVNLLKRMTIKFKIALILALKRSRLPQSRWKSDQAVTGRMEMITPSRIIILLRASEKRGNSKSN